MLKGKAAIVTGSTSGIGLGIARALAEVRCNIMLNGFGEASAIELEREKIATEFGVKVALQWRGFIKASGGYANGRLGI